jgi:hypothetical protein
LGRRKESKEIEGRKEGNGRTGVNGRKDTRTGRSGERRYIP